jgi:hypothetical protein
VVAGGDSDVHLIAVISILINGPDLGIDESAFTAADTMLDRVRVEEF